MKHCILIHGKPSKKEYDDPGIPSPSNHHWFPWIQKQLLLNDVLTQSIEMPRPYAPVYGSWADVLDQIGPNSQTSLVGHSCGAGFIIRYLSERSITIDTLVLVAPWLDPVRKSTTDFFQFIPDKNLLTRVRKAHILYSLDDPAVGIIESVTILRNLFPSMLIHEFHNKGHFTIDEMKTTEFPELLSIILSTHD